MSQGPAIIPLSNWTGLDSVPDENGDYPTDGGTVFVLPQDDEQDA